MKLLKLYQQIKIMDFELIGSDLTDCYGGSDETFELISGGADDDILLLVDKLIKERNIINIYKKIYNN